MRSRNEIGFGKKIRAAWLDSALEYAVTGTPFALAQKKLAKEIAANNSGAEAIRKIQTCLKRVWFSPPDYCRALREDALSLFRESTSTDTRLLLNWGMTIAAYPFVGNVGEAIGRLFKLQKEARRADIERRLREQHGDRDFIDRATRYNVSSFLDWGVIGEAKRRGVYEPGNRTRPKNSKQFAWLVEAVLLSRGETQMAFPQLRHHPILFPISLETFNTSVLRTHPRLKVIRQGLNEEFVVFEETTPRSPLFEQRSLIFTDSRLF